MAIKNILGEVWPQWRIAEAIGQGGYGKVYKIERDDIGGHFESALKVISIPNDTAEVEAALTEGMTMDDATDYFRGVVEEIVKEFTIMERLKGNTNIVDYEDHAVLQHDNDPGWDILIRMELLTPLTKEMRSRTFTEEEVIKIGLDLCTALELCSKNHIIHRDIKPENIFISKNGDYKLGDFGVARTAEKTMSALSKKGTYTYMAPEVFKGDNYDSSVDIYSLGLVLYRLLNGNRDPFLPPAPAKITFAMREQAMTRRMSGESFPLPVTGSREMAAILQKACAFKAENRYQTASEMKEDLNKIYQAKTNPPVNKILSKDSDEAMTNQGKDDDQGQEAALPKNENDHTAAIDYSQSNYNDHTDYILDNGEVAVDPEEDKTVGLFDHKPMKEEAVYSENIEGKIKEKQQGKPSRTLKAESKSDQKKSKKPKLFAAVILLLGIFIFGGYYYVSNVLPIAYLKDYKPPKELSKDPRQPEMDLDGKLYRLPCPMSEFLDDGWKPVFYDWGYSYPSGMGIKLQEDPSNELNKKSAMSIQIIKDKYKLNVSLCNFANKKVALEDTVVIMIETSEEYGKESSMIHLFSGGVNVHDFLKKEIFLANAGFDIDNPELLPKYHSYSYRPDKEYLNISYDTDDDNIRVTMYHAIWDY